MMVMMISFFSFSGATITDLIPTEYITLLITRTAEVRLTTILKF